MKRAAALAVALLIAAPATAQALVPTNSVGDTDRMRPERTGRLLGTELRVEAIEVPARDFMQALARAVDLPLLAHWDEAPGDHGLEPDLPVTMSIERADALFVLELALEQVALWEPCTWQIRNGFLEVGTKARLAPYGETRVYDIEDVLIEPEGFSDGSFGHRYADAALSRPTPIGVWKRNEQIANEVMQSISQIIDPGNWDVPPRTEQSDWDRDRSKTKRTEVDTNSTRMARMRSFRGGKDLMIHAPPFVHRAIAGSGSIVWPPRADAETCAERTARLRTSAWRLEVLSIGPPPSAGPAP